MTVDNGQDKRLIGGKEFNSRFILGSGGYHADFIRAAVEEAGAEIVTMAVRRADPGTESKEILFRFLPV